MLKQTSILGIKITQSDKKDIISFIFTYLEKKPAKPLTIFTPNPEIIVQAFDLKEFARILNSSDINLPDGQRLLWASRKLYPDSPQKHITKRIAGVEFMEELVKVATAKKYQVGLIGGHRGVAERTLIKLKNKYPNLTGWAIDGPEIQVQNAEIITAKVGSRQSSTSNEGGKIQTEDTEKYFEILSRKVIETDISFLFVGLGAPKQEMLIEKLKAEIMNVKRGKPLVLMSVGGAFDMLSGRIARAPSFMRNFEFVWRFILEPYRFFRFLRLLRFVGLTFANQSVLK